MKSTKTRIIIVGSSRGAVQCVVTDHASKPTASKHAERLAQKAKYDRRAAKVQEGWREYESLTGKFTVSNRKGKQS